MAAASPPTFPLAFLRLCYCLFFVVFIQHVPCATPLSFDINTATNPCDNELECKGNAYFNPPVIELTKNDRTVESSHSLGWVWYKQSVPLWDNATGEVASFNTTFSFQIKAEKQSSVGDGMAFFLSRFPPRCLNTSGGGNLGLYNDSDNLGATGDGRAVAVEFDTYSNSYESATQHVGIDVNSIQSVAYTDTSSTGRNLTSDITMVAMVKYDNETKLLNVDLQIGDVWYNVNATVDLKTKLPGEVAVGFSGATGVNAELHRVRSWKFSSSLEEKKALMAIPPAPALASQPRPVPGVKSEPSTKLLLKVLSPVALVSVSAIVAVLWLWQKRRRNVQPEKATTDSESDEPRAEADFERGVAGPKRYHYRDLAAATGYFAEDNKLGRGGFGSVYKGCLSMDDGQQLVAIKKFSLESSQGRKEFEAEVKIISRLRHRNLVQLLGWCDSLKGLLLVYELVEEGSLDKHIHNNERLLTWPDRYKIILGLGSALRYLHLEWEQCVVHGDIKPSNIMLDSLYNTKLGDFGLARLVDHGTGPQTTKHVQGTVGYIDPEFVNTLRRSTESDVYSFGIVLLEIVSGRQPVDRQEPSFMLLRWVYSLYSQGSTLDAANARLRGDEADERQMERVLVVGLWCAQHDPGQRPTVAQAMHVLQSEEAKLPALPPQMYKLVAPMSIAMGESSASGSSLSSGVRSSATTGTTRSSGSFAN